MGRVKEKLVETETTTNSGRKVKIKFGTEMVTATGSGRKVTLKGPKKPLTLVKTPEKKHSAVVKKSSGLNPDKITSLLDSDAEMEEEKKPVKPKVMRKRRASVSCTTPPKLNTPVKAKKKAASRPTSEVKPKANRRRSSYAKAKSEEESADSDDDDFIPKPKSRKAPPKVVVKKVESSEEPSDESEEESGNESEEEEEEPSPKKKRKMVNKPTKKEGLTKPGARQPLKRKSFQPKMAPRPKPLSKAVNSMTEAQQRLHVSAVPESLPCREDEFAEVGIL